MKDFRERSDRERREEPNLSQEGVLPSGRRT